MNGAIQRPGLTTGGRDGRGDGVEVGREPLVGREPVTDGGLEAVVELEDVERPVAGQRQVRSQVGLGHEVEVVVPGAPAHLVRRRHPGPADPADLVGPVLEQHRGVGAVGGPVGHQHRVQRRAPRRARSRRRRGRPRPTAPGPTSPSRSRRVPSWRSPPSKPTSSGAEPAACSTVTHSERSSPGRAIDWSAWCTPAGQLDRARRASDGSRSMPNTADPARRPRLVAVAEHPQRRRPRRPAEHERHRPDRHRLRRPGWRSTSSGRPGVEPSPSPIVTSSGPTTAASRGEGGRPDDVAGQFDAIRFEVHRGRLRKLCRSLTSDGSQLATEASVRLHADQTAADVRRAELA